MRCAFVVAVLTIAVAVHAEQDVPLLMPDEPAMGWVFDNGREFPGAKGELVADAAVKHDNRASLRLVGDFTGGGNYVQMSREVSALNLTLSSLSFWLRAPGVSGLGMRLIDGSGQCHQISLQLDGSSGDWRFVSFPVERFFANRGTAEAVKGVAKYEHWGGANDGKWHGIVKLIVLLVGRQGEGKTPETLWFSGMSASTHATAYACDFEGSASVPADWTVEGAVSIDPKDAFQGSHALRLERRAADIEKTCSAIGPKFAISPGAWQVSGALRSELNSPDASYNGTLALEVLDAGGKVLETVMLGETFGKHAWQLARKHVEVGNLAVAARFTVRLNKADGKVWVDALAAASARNGSRAPVVERLVLASTQLGNLLHPNDPRTFSIRVESFRELSEAEQKLTWVVRDYWGAEQNQRGTVKVAAKGKNKNRFVYEGQLDLAGVQLEVGRYYELHAIVPLGDGEAFKNSAGFAILPEAPNKRFKPEQIPFTSRNWDNRIGEYLRLTDRIGIRVAGIWGGWPAKPPYKPDAPGSDICAELGMGMLTGCPSYAIESHQKGFEQYDEAALREGARNFAATFGKIRPLIIDLGNEPHSSGERLKEAVRAYTIVYDEFKKIDPTITVIATSVSPWDEYFAAGYQHACDAFDFHVYESPENVRQAIQQYQKLMEKYKCVKPIWSTEIGLNSQGLTRQHIAGDMIRKFAIFFSAGGENMSWFDFLYPDPDAKNFGTSGDSMNIFDSRYCKYAARLDAVTLYNLVNGIGAKKFARERSYPDGIHAVLFRDGEQHAFVVLWKDRGRKDVALALPDVKAIQVIDIDGRRTVLDAGGKGVMLTANEDPLLLNFDGAADLPETLSDAPVSITAFPASMVRGVAASFELVGMPDPKQVHVIAPPEWKIEGVCTTRPAVLRYSLVSPESSSVREGEVLVRVGAGGLLTFRPIVCGHLTLEVRPVPYRADGKAAAELRVHNYSSETQTLTWSIALSGERSLSDGEFGTLQPTAAYFSEATNGTLTVPAQQQASVAVPLAGANPLKLYAATATIMDATGGTLKAERLLGGFVAVPKVAATLNIDGTLDEADWKRAPIQHLNQKQQYFTLDKSVQWKGPADLSATLRFLWDDKYLYVGVEAADDVFANSKQDGEIWAGDGLQFLIDPKRDSAEKAGKYDFAMALGKKGPQAWCFLSGASTTPVGPLTDVLVACKPHAGDGGMTYELAIPWARIAPFTPAPGANLGLAMIVNEDDGHGRTGFMGWFGNPHTKQIDTVGDLVLMNE